MKNDETPPRRGRLDGWPAFLRVPIRFMLRVSRALLRRPVAVARRLHPRRLAATWRFVASLAGGVRRRRRSGALTVAVDINPFWEPLTGVGWYLYLLLESLAATDGVELRLYGPQLVTAGDDPGPAVELPRGPAIEVVSTRVSEDLCLPAGMVLGMLRAAEPMLVAADGNRVLFAPNFTLPPRLRRAGGRLVATVHDLAFRRLPWTVRDATRRELERNLSRTLERAARIITPSRTVRDELVAGAGLEPGRVVAVHHGPGHLARLASGCLPEAVTEDFVLHVGTLEPRKNLETLLAAWEELDRRGRAPQLVLVGGYGWKSEELEALVAEGREAGRVVHLGYVAESQLAALYGKAQLVVCPSLYEGFGLPVVEAMWAGRPVLCSDIPVFREVAEDGARFVAAQDVEAWVEALAELLGSSSARDELAARGRTVVSRLDWQRAAVETVAIWRAAAAT